MTDAVLQAAELNYVSDTLRQQVREQIAADTLAFIRQGGSITCCPCYTPVERSKPAFIIGGQP